MLSRFLKQFIFISSLIAILTIGGLVIYSATPSGSLKINPNLTPKIKMVKQENTTTTGNNPVGWWKMDEGTASSSFDSSGNGNTGTLTGGVQWATGKLGKGLRFDGVNDYVDLTGFTATGGTYTFSFWAKSGDIHYTGNDFFIDMQTPRFILSRQTNTFQFYDGAYKNFGSGISFAPYINSWHYFSWVFNTNNTTAYLYIDGVLKGSNGTYSSKDIGASIGLMARYNGVTYNMAGLLDDVRIYNRALSSSEVQQQYNSTKDGYLGNIKVSTGITAYFKLDEASWATTTNATPVKDYSGKGNNGTPYNHASTTAGQIGRAGIFDGIDDYVSANVNRTDLTTISFWIKPNSTTQSILELNATNSVAVSSGVISATGFGTPTIYVDGVSTTSLPNTNWHFITINPTIKMTGNGLNIGKVSTTYYAGLLDDIKIYNKTLVASQIYNDFVRGASGREQ